MIKKKEIEKDDSTVLFKDALGQDIRFGDIVCFNSSYATHVGIAYGSTPHDNLRVQYIAAASFDPDDDEYDPTIHPVFYSTVFQSGVSGRMIIKLHPETAPQMMHPNLYGSLCVEREKLVNLRND